MTELEKIEQDFEYLDSWEEKYQYIIELGEKINPLDEQYKTDIWKVIGCQSQVWLVPKTENGKYYFYADSDAIIVKGLIAVVLAVYNNKTAMEIKNIDIGKIFAKLGLKENLSPSRRNGMMSMVAKIREYAI